MSEVLAALYEGRRSDVAGAADESLDVLEAAALGRVARLSELLTADPSGATLRSDDGFTALHYAAFFGGADVAALLLRAGADPGAVAGNDMRVQPLHSAVAASAVDVVRLLVAAGVDLEAEQEGGYTALQAAGQHDQTEVVALLLAAGADPASLDR